MIRENTTNPSLKLSFFKINNDRKDNKVEIKVSTEQTDLPRIPFSRAVSMNSKDRNTHVSICCPQLT